MSFEEFGQIGLWILSFGCEMVVASVKQDKKNNVQLRSPNFLIINGQSPCFLRAACICSISCISRHVSLQFRKNFRNGRNQMIALFTDVSNLKENHLC